MTFSITAPAVQEILAAAARSDAVGLALRVVGAPSRRWLEGTVLDYVAIEPGRHDFIFVATALSGVGCGQ